MHRELASGLSCPVGFKMALMVRLKWLSMPLMPPVRHTASCRNEMGAFGDCEYQR
ncbi:MAG: hypothetical protein ACLRP3_20030 [Escherichia sp.]